MAHISMQLGCLFEEEAFVGRFHTQLFIAIESITPLLAHLINAGQLYQNLWFISNPSLSYLQSTEKA